MTDLDELIQYWKDYRASGKLGLDDLEKVNHLLICLEDYKELKTFGIVGSSHSKQQQGKELIEG